MKQEIITSDKNYQGIDIWIKKHCCNKILLVCGSSIHHQLNLIAHLKKIEDDCVELIKFQKFQPNPLYENVLDGVQVFRKELCDAIIAVGGGSAIDVAKCIKLYAKIPDNGQNGSWLNEVPVENNIPFLAIPTTAGSGSEATKYAVIYYKGKKQSITSENIIPQTVLLAPDTLKTLPDYQKKATMCDALCHAIESFWSLNSTDESKELSRSAIHTIIDNIDDYINNKESGLKNMLIAANTAGKAINITQTTAGHAMSYKITSLFGCSHGHATILCNRILFSWMIDNVDRCVDPRGKEYLKRTLNEIGIAMGCKNAESGAKKLQKIFMDLKFQIPKPSETQYTELKTSVNPIRLKNNPIKLDIETIDKLYREVLK